MFLHKHVRINDTITFVQPNNLHLSYLQQEFNIAEPVSLGYNELLYSSYRVVF